MILPDHPESSQAFHVRKKRKNYAMFIYDLFHTVLELPFLGLYPMVFCLYVLASGTCFKMLLYACGGKRTFSLKGGWVLYRKLSMLWVHIFTRCFEPCLHWTCEMNYATVAFLTLAAQQLLESFLDVPPGFVPLHLCSGLVVHF